ncbi:mannose-6-phosphate isomerase, class I [Vibrio natriegens]|uniref:mannose-6-phosphate isomerase, class I n=1 Tax=Vibrio natriegens TaxID=691 RepID=UPI0021E8B06B|nr:mannose-6-phosphate isomerase, class I [Vibrio natriegens]UYI47319.1 mannose-6-phosphate isomerase, class I [Vibrio natriegens]
MIFRLSNPIKNFEWGCKYALSELFGIPNPDMRPQAELWMGAHSNGSSLVNIRGEDLSLADAINSDSAYWLGEQMEKGVEQLPFLVKILAANQPLSIQVHPSKAAAETGFEKENALGVAFDAPERNYKDSNHKPELVYAITPYLAMNGFRQLDEIHNLFSAMELPSVALMLEPFLSNPSKQTLERLFAAILQLDESEKQQAVSELLNFDSTKDHSAEITEAFQLITELAKLYPDDVGLFSPLFLNIIELQPGEAMFLYAETPHSYLKGVGVEVMANSDNVLRAGLTPKYIDVPELIANTKFESIKPSALKMEPTKQGERLIYPIPVEDFKFDIIDDAILDITVLSPEILLCVNGSAEIKTEQNCVMLKAGESVMIPAATSSYSLNSQGVVARTYC